MPQKVMAFFWFTMSFARTIGYSEVPTAGLVELGRSAGFSEASLRMLLSRYKQQGVVIPRKQGRESFYSLSPDFRHMVENKVQEAEHQLTSEEPCWIGVSYEFPEGEAGQRDALISQLESMGFARYYGLWIYPLDRSGELALFAQHLGVHRDRYTIFKLAFFPGDNVKKLTQELWHLEKISAILTEEYEQNRRMEETLSSFPPEKTFAELFVFSLRMDHLERQAPLLPAELLPPDCIFSAFFNQARRIREKLAEKALPYVLQALGPRDTDTKE